MSEEKHWTEESDRDFVYFIASGFVARLDERMGELGLTRGELARKLEVTDGRVSQIFNNPGNLTLTLIVRCARAVGIKVAVLAYDDNDEKNLNGPIISEVFQTCWENYGKPKNMFDFGKNSFGGVDFKDVGEWENVLDNLIFPTFRGWKHIIEGAGALNSEPSGLVLNLPQLVQKQTT